MTQLRAENQALREALNLALEQLSQVQEQLHVALARIEELEKQKMPSPAFVKENVKKPQAKEKKPRKQRDAKHNHGRQRMEPTQIVEHRITSVPWRSAKSSWGLSTPTRPLASITWQNSTMRKASTSKPNHSTSVP